MHETQAGRMLAAAMYGICMAGASVAEAQPSNGDGKKSRQGRRSQWATPRTPERRSQSSSLETMLKRAKRRV